MLLFSGFVADSRSEVDGVAVRKDALLAPGADQHPKTGLLEDVDVVIVCVAHRPTGGVPFGLLAVRRVDKLAVVIGPFAKVIKATNLLTKTRNWHIRVCILAAMEISQRFFY